MVGGPNAQVRFDVGPSRLLGWLVLTCPFGEQHLSALLLLLRCARPSQVVFGRSQERHLQLESHFGRRLSLYLRCGRGCLYVGQRGVVLHSSNNGRY